MRVFLAGATGAIGKRLVPQLVANGHRVTGTTRSVERTAELRALGADVAVVDGLDARGVHDAVVHAEPDAIIHQMTALSGTADFRHFDRWFAATNELRTVGTQNLLAAADAAGVRRFVAQSFTGWNNIRQGGWVKTEDDPFDPDPADAQVETLAAIRFLERAILAAPLEGIVLRYGNLYGPGASEPLVELVRERKLPIIGGGNGVWSWTHIDDAASATVAALERGRRGVYDIVDDEPARMADFLPSVADSVGAKPPMRIPAWLGRLLAGPALVQAMTEGRGASNAKARRELGWQPGWPSWRDGFRNGLAGAPGEARPRGRVAAA